MANKPEYLDLNTLTPARLSEIQDLLTYESSIAFYSNRAHESMWLLWEAAAALLKLIETAKAAGSEPTQS